MQLLPVMDLLDGQVVRAIAGQRANYRPIVSGLVGSAEPAAVMRALLGLARFSGFYIADLDAIARAGSDRHFDQLAALCVNLAHCKVDELWLDAGSAPWLSVLGTVAAANGIRLVPVLGSESLVDADALSAQISSLAGLDCVLSLDYRCGEFLGPIGLDQRPAEWPQRVIVMDLAAVGVDGGPAFRRLDQITATARTGDRPELELYAAGGIRGGDDLRTLMAHGARGALLASALHDGRVDAQALREFVAAV